MSSVQKFTAILAAMLLIVGGYFAFQAFGGTTLGVTLESNAQLQNGLVGHWTFDGADLDWAATGAEVLDTSGNGYDGEAQGTVSATSSPTVGVIGQAFQLDGSSDGVRAVFSQPTTEISISFWARPDSVTPSHEYDAVSAGLSTAAFRGLQVIFFTDGYLYFGTGDGTAYTYLQSTDTFTTEWQHIVVTWDGTTKRMYINGVPDVNTESFSGPIVYNSTTVYLGKGWSTGGWFGGDLDDIRMYDRALTAAEVERLYGLGATTHIAQTLNTNPDLESGLVGHWTFDGPDMDWGSTTAEVKDVSGNGYAGDAQGSLAVTSTTVGPLGQALSFNGLENGVFMGDILDIENNEPVSLAAWVRFNDAGATNEQIVGKKSNVSPFAGYRLVTDSGSDLIRFDMTGGSLGRSVAIDTVQSYTGKTEWMHVVGTYDGSQDASGMKIYINGTQAATSVFDNDITGSSLHDLDFTIGTRQASNNPLDGDIDDVRVYSRALSAEEIKRLYGLGATTHIAQTLTTNPDLENGLVGHWTFDGPDMDWGSSTAEVKDRSGNGNDGDASSTMSSIVSGDTGRLGQSVHIRDVAEYISMGDLDLLDNVSACTLTAWVKLETIGAAADTYLIVGAYDGPFEDGTEYALQTRNESGVETVRFIVSDSSLNLSDIVQTDTTDLQTDTWYHIAAVWAGGNAYTLYLDGQSVSYTIPLNEAVSSITPTTSNLTVGAITGGATPLPGNIDDVRIYNRALSASEVKRLYELGQ